MLRPSDYHDLLSGHRRDLRARLLRSVLTGASVGYRAGIWWHNARYDHRWKACHEMGVPVVSVGNLTTGGTGKTPFVAWLAQWLRRQAVRVTLISRGYGAELGASNDEALELEWKLPDVPHVQNPDRVAAAELAIEELAAQFLLLDDAFQHRRIARDLDIVLLDALVPFGYGHLLPRGTLREPLANLRRADVVALSRCNLVPEAERRRIRERVHKLHPQATWLEVAQVPLRYLRSDRDLTPLAALAGQPVLAFCGIGNPRGFRATLEGCDVELREFREFPDHHPFDARDVGDLEDWIRRHQPAAAVCTMKDLVKIRVPQLAGVPLLGLEIGSEIRVGQDDLERRLQPLVERALTRDPLENPGQVSGNGLAGGGTTQQFPRD